MRGCLFALEGLDRSGKTLQSNLLYEYLTKNLNKKCLLLRFPGMIFCLISDRQTEIGKVIDKYLKNQQKCKLEDHAIHLLFTANRFERKYAFYCNRNEIIKALEEGIIVILDRYSYSGVAYTSAKWCMSPERDLPKPDLVLFLNSSKNGFHSRNGFGQEVYEKNDFQSKVAQQYEKLSILCKQEGHNWAVIDGADTPEMVNAKIISHITPFLNFDDLPDLKYLW